MSAMDLLHPTRGLPVLLAPPFPGVLQKALQQPTKCSCNHLHFCFATIYILGLQLSTFLFYNKQIVEGQSGGLAENKEQVDLWEFIILFVLAPLDLVKGLRVT